MKSIINNPTKDYLMKAFIVILTTILSAMVLKVADYFTNTRGIKSVGAKSNKESRNIPKIDITNQNDLKKALEYYKEMAD